VTEVGLEARAAAWIDGDASIVNDPYVLWSDLRARCPVVHEPGHGVWLVSRYDDCRAISRDSQTWSSILAAKGPIRSERRASAQAVCEYVRAVGEGESPEDDISVLIDAALHEQDDQLQHNDPPSYARYRSLISRWFTPARVSALEPLVRSTAIELIDAMLAGRDGDPTEATEFLSAFAGPLPGTIIAELLDVPGETRDDFIEWDKEVHGNTQLFEDSAGVAAYDERARRIGRWLGDAVNRRRIEPGDDLISELVSTPLDDGTMLGDDHARAIAHTFHVGGQETTSKLLTSAMRLVAADPELQSTLRADPALIPAFVEEALRIQSPTQGLFRVARVDTEVGGTSFPAGALVQLLWGSANRDEATFPEPDRVVLDRANPRSHLAFGHGIHLCPGNHLARLEARVAFEELLARTADIELDASNTFEYMSSHIMRGLRRLDVLLTSAT
jgi:cytochrome P450 family 150 subfamily A5